MNVLVVEDDRRIKEDAIDDVLISLGHHSDWAQNQQEANALLDAGEYDLILLDLQIPSRPGGKDHPEFGRNLLWQIRAREDRARTPVILITGQHQQCVDLFTDLNEIGIDGSIAKPFPAAGRTLAVVIGEVMDRHRRFRQTAATETQDVALQPFQGGVMAFHPGHVELCGVTVLDATSRGCAWSVLQQLRGHNDSGKRVHRGSQAMIRGLDSPPTQNTLIKAIGTLRGRISRLMASHLSLDCGDEDVIAKDEAGYYLPDWIVIEEYDDRGTLVGSVAMDGSGAENASDGMSDRQRWVLDQLHAGVTITRKAVEDHFGIGERTAKRILMPMTRDGLIVYDPTEKPGVYRIGCDSNVTGVTRSVSPVTLR